MLEHNIKCIVLFRQLYKFFKETKYYMHASNSGCITVYWNFCIYIISVLKAMWIYKNDFLLNELKLTLQSYLAFKDLDFLIISLKYH